MAQACSVTAGAGDTRGYQAAASGTIKGELQGNYQIGKDIIT